MKKAHDTVESTGSFYTNKQKCISYDCLYQGDRALHVLCAGRLRLAHVPAAQQNRARALGSLEAVHKPQVQEKFSFFFKNFEADCQPSILQALHWVDIGRLENGQPTGVPGNSHCTVNLIEITFADGLQFIVKKSTQFSQIRGE